MASSNVPGSTCAYSTVITKLYDTYFSCRHSVQSPNTTANAHDAPPGLATVHNCLRNCACWKCPTRPFRSPLYRYGGIIRPFSTSLAAQDNPISSWATNPSVPRSSLWFTTRQERITTTMRAFAQQHVHQPCPCAYFYISCQLHRRKAILEVRPPFLRQQQPPPRERHIHSPLVPHSIEDTEYFGYTPPTRTSRSSAGTTLPSISSPGPPVNLGQWSPSAAGVHAPGVGRGELDLMVCFRWTNAGEISACVHSSACSWVPLAALVSPSFCETPRSSPLSPLQPLFLTSPPLRIPLLRSSLLVLIVVSKPTRGGLGFLLQGRGSVVTTTAFDMVSGVVFLRKEGVSVSTVGSRRRRPRRPHLAPPLPDNVSSADVSCSMSPLLPFSSPGLGWPPTICSGNSPSENIGKLVSKAFVKVVAACRGRSRRSVTLCCVVLIAAAPVVTVPPCAATTAGDEEEILVE